MNPPPQTPATSPRTAFGLSALLLVLIAAAFWQLPGNGFITYDDPFYVTKNPDVNGGLTAHNVKWAFTAMHASNWHPLTWLSHMLDCEWFGLNARAHHLLNLAWHSANALLLFALLRRLTGSTWRSWFVAALFAVHPMHVESVAWVSERKDVLSTFFFMLTLLSYARFVQRKSWLAYGWVLVCFALGLLSKPMLVTLPCVLLLLDFWPLGRYEWKFTVENLNRFSRLLLEKIPFFLLTGLSCVMTVIAQTRGGSVAPTLDIGLTQRIVNSVIAYGWYVWRLFVPMDQAIIYPLLPERETWQIIVAAAFVVAATGFAIWRAGKRPWFAFGWFWFLGVLVPVIGLVQVGMQAYADRYTYLSYVGLFIALIWSAEELTRRWAGRVRALGTVGVLLLIGCMDATQQVLKFWKDDETLYRRALAVTENNYIALNNLGFALSERGEYEEAIRYCEASLRIAPRFAEAHNTIGCARLGQKKPELAVAAFEQAVSYRPFSAMYRNNLGTAWHELKRYEEAVGAYDAALQVDPEYADAHYNRGNSLGALGQSTNAIASYERAIALRPGFADAHLNLGYELLQAGRRPEARRAFEAALRASRECINAHYALGQLSNDEGDFAAAEKHWRIFLTAKPEHVGARAQLAVALIAEKNFADAIRELREAISRSPESAPAHFWLAVALEQNGNAAEARDAYEKTIALDPNHAEALNNLAWLLTSSAEPAVRDGQRAVTLAQRACELTKNESALFLGTLAAAYAEAGDFASASRTAESARDLAQKNSQSDLVRKNEELLALYRAGKTCCDLKTETTR